MNKNHPNFNIEPKKKVKSNWMKGFVLKPKATELDKLDFESKHRGSVNKKLKANI